MLQYISANVCKGRGVAGTSSCYSELSEAQIYVVPNLREVGLHGFAKKLAERIWMTKN